MEAALPAPPAVRFARVGRTRWRSPIQGAGGAGISAGKEAGIPPSSCERRRITPPPQGPGSRYGLAAEDCVVAPPPRGCACDTGAECAISTTAITSVTAPAAPAIQVRYIPALPVRLPRNPTLGSTRHGAHGGNPRFLPGNEGVTRVWRAVSAPGRGARPVPGPAGTYRNKPGTGAGAGLVLARSWIIGPGK